MKILIPSKKLYLVSGILLTGFCWNYLWTHSYYFSPLLFTGLWTGAIVTFYSISTTGYPGFKYHIFSSCISIPLWWWFEFANSYLNNWKYVTEYDYGMYPYIFLASIAFSTVVPALDSSHKIVQYFFPKDLKPVFVNVRQSPYIELTLGIAAIILMYLFPRFMFPMLWIGPLLIIDFLAGVVNERSFVHHFVQGKHMVLISLGLSGIFCGFMWEFWNNWASPSWAYQIPYLDFLHVFEMPILGYLGYIPFAWTVYQYQNLMKTLVNKYIFKQDFIVSI